MNLDKRRWQLKESESIEFELYADIQTGTIHTVKVIPVFNQHTNFIGTRIIVIEVDNGLPNPKSGYSNLIQLGLGETKHMNVSLLEAHMLWTISITRDSKDDNSNVVVIELLPAVKMNYEKMGLEVK